MQVLLGDLNAEPHSRGIKFLRGEVNLMNQKSDVRDAWLQLHPEPTADSKEADDLAAFTFPVFLAEKRIDYTSFGA